MPNLRWLITELARRLWVRASIFAVAGIFTAIIGGPAFLWMLRPHLGRGG